MSTALIKASSALIGKSSRSGAHKARRAETRIPTSDRHGKDVIHIKFNPTDCKACPSRGLCTQAKAGARMLAIHPDQAQHQTLQKARLRQKAPDFKQKYAKRAGIEGTISEARSRV